MCLPTETIEEFARLVQEWLERYPGFEVVICQCRDCKGKAGRWRSTCWAVNTAERKIYL